MHMAKTDSLIDFVADQVFDNDLVACTGTLRYEAERQRTGDKFTPNAARDLRTYVADSVGLTNTATSVYPISPSQLVRAVTVVPTWDSGKADADHQNPFDFTECFSRILCESAIWVCNTQRTQANDVHLVHREDRLLRDSYSGLSYTAAISALFVKLIWEPDVEFQSCSIEQHSCDEAGCLPVTYVSFMRNERPHRAYVGGVCEPRFSLLTTQTLLEAELRANAQASRVSEIYILDTPGSKIFNEFCSKCDSNASLGDVWAYDRDSKTKYRNEAAAG